MKKHTYLLLVCTIISMYAHAQTLTATACPDSGTIVNRFNMDTTSLTEGPAGTGVNWNFSQVAQQSITMPIIYNVPSANDLLNFPDANLTQHYLQSDVTSFFQKTATQLVYLGDDGGAGTYINSDPEVQMIFPASVGTINSDNWVDIHDDFFGGSHAHGSTVYTVDGFGTLITPNDTFPNVFRNKTISDYTDSVFQSGSLQYVFTTHEVKYNWVMNGNGEYLFQISSGFTVGGGNTSSYKTAYMNSRRRMTSGINAVYVVKDIALYPNPAANNVNITINLEHDTKTTLHITNMVGQTVNDGDELNLLQGKNEIQLNISSLHPGFYFLVASTNMGTVTKPLVIE